MTKRKLKPSDPLLVGRLEPFDRGVGLYLLVWCPYCKCEHQHGFGIEESMNAVSHRVAHCYDNASPFHKYGYHVGVDPRFREQNRKAIAAVKARQLVPGTGA